MFNDNRPAGSNYSIGLAVRIPIFTGFRDTYTARQAQIRAESAAADRDVLFRQAEVEVWQGFLRSEHSDQQHFQYTGAGAFVGTDLAGHAGTIPKRIRQHSRFDHRAAG